MTRIQLTAPVRATERPEAVREAMRRFFPDAVEEPASNSALVTMASEDLLAFRQRIWELRIIDAARGQLLRGMDASGKRLAVRLSKQAALAGHVSFPARPHALGDIDLVIERNAGIEPVVAWLCPATLEGEIVAMPGPQP